MKSFLYTSSSTAATNPYPNKKFHISKDSWNDKAVEDAWAPAPYEPSRAWAVYGASKMQGEKEVWKWTEENKPHFSVNSVLPNANFGEILDPENQSASTAGWIRAMASGSFEKIKSIPPREFCWPTVCTCADIHSQSTSSTFKTLPDSMQLSSQILLSTKSGSSLSLSHTTGTRCSRSQDG
jgi:hypothetical protein